MLEYSICLALGALGHKSEPVRLWVRQPRRLAVCCVLQLRLATQRPHRRFRYFGIVEKVKDVYVVQLAQRGDLGRGRLDASLSGRCRQSNETMCAPATDMLVLYASLIWSRNTYCRMALKLMWPCLPR